MHALLSRLLPQYMLRNFLRLARYKHYNCEGSTLDIEANNSRLRHADSERQIFYRAYNICMYVQLRIYRLKIAASVTISFCFQFYKLSKTYKYPMMGDSKNAHMVHQ